MSVASSILAEAKQTASAAAETVSATLTEVKALSAEVKRGLKEITLDENFTYKVAFKGRYYCYTYIDKQIRLVRIMDIPEHEKGEIFSSSAANELFIDEKYGETKPGKSETKKKK